MTPTEPTMDEPQGTKVRRLLLVGAGYAALAMLFFSNVLFTKEFTLVHPKDTIDLSYSNIFYIIKCFKQGLLPLWDPNLMCGMPLAGYPQYGVFYPLNLLLILVPSEIPLTIPTFELFSILHVVIAGLGMYYLCRTIALSPMASFVGGIVFMFSYFMILYMVWLNNFMAYAWLPLFMGLLISGLAAKDPKHRTVRYVGAGMVFGVLGLASPAQPMIFALLIFAAILAHDIVRDWPGRNLQRYLLHRLPALLAVVVGISIVAISLIPIMEFQPHATRFLGEAGTISGGARMSFEGFTKYYLEPGTLFGLFLPNFVHGTAGGLYFGFVPVVLSIFGIAQFRTNRYCSLFVVVMAVALFYSIGAFTWLPNLFYQIPLLNQIRESDRYLLLVALAVPPLGAMGFDRLFRTPDSSSMVSRTEVFVKGLLVFLAVICSIILIYAVFLNGVSLLPLLDKLAILFLVALCFDMILRMIVKHGPSLSAQIVVVLLSVFELFQLSAPMYGGTILKKSTFDPDQYLRGIHYTDSIKAQNEIFRVAPVESDKGWPYPVNAGDITGLQQTFGYANPILTDFFVYRNRVGFSSHYYDILNVKYFITDKNSDSRMANALAQDTNLVLTNRGEIGVYLNRNYLPRAFFVDGAVIAGSDRKERVMGLIEQRDFDPRVLAVFEEAIAPEDQEVLRNSPPRRMAGDDVRIADYSPNTIRLSALTTTARFMVLSELYYPGWIAKIDGREAHIYRADRILRAIVIPPGSHEIVFEYTPQSFRAGAVISVLTILFSLALITGIRRIPDVLARILIACLILMFILTASFSLYAGSLG